MKTMDCKDIQANLSGLLDDELTPERRHLAERHLVSCELCRTMIDDAERADALVSADVGAWLDESSGLPQGFIDGVLGRTVQSDRRDRIAGWVAWSGWLAAAASLALAATIWFVDRATFMAESEQNGSIAMQDARSHTADRESDDAADDHVTSDRHDESHAALTMPHNRSGASIITASYMPGPEVRPFITDDPLFVAGAGPHQSNVRVDMLASPLDIARAATTDGQSMAQPTDADRRQSAPPSDNDRRSDSTLAQPVENRAPAAARTVDTPQPTIARDDAETLYAASLTLELLRDADDSTFADAERIRRIAESDDLLNRLAIARNRVGVEDRPLLLAAEGVLLRVVRGPLSLEELHELREATARLDLAEQLDALSQRPMQRDSI